MRLLYLRDSPSRDSHPIDSGTELKALERDAYLRLPASAKVLVSDSDEEGRGGPACHLWLIQSTERISLVPNPPAVVEHSWENGQPGYLLDVFNVYLSKHLSKANSSVEAAWHIGGYDYRAELLRTDDMDFLHVQRFKSQP